jgi:hypothetical protein
VPARGERYACSGANREWENTRLWHSFGCQIPLGAIFVDYHADSRAVHSDWQRDDAPPSWLQRHCRCTFNQDTGGDRTAASPHPCREPPHTREPYRTVAGAVLPTCRLASSQSNISSLMKQIGSLTTPSYCKWTSFCRIALTRVCTLRSSAPRFLPMFIVLLTAGRVHNIYCPEGASPSSCRCQADRQP